MDEQVLARVFEAAEPPLAERGFFRVTLEEVAEAAGVSPSDVAAEFADTGALVVRLVETRGRELRAYLHRAVEGLTSRSMMEGTGFRAFFAWVAEHPHMYSLTRQAELIDRDAYRTWYRELAGDYLRGLTLAMEEGEIARADPETLAYCLMGMADFLGMRYILWDRRAELPQEAWSTLQRILTRLLSPGPGGLR